MARARWMLGMLLVGGVGCGAEPEPYLHLAWPDGELAAEVARHEVCDRGLGIALGAVEDGVWVDVFPGDGEVVVRTGGSALPEADGLVLTDCAWADGLAGAVSCAAPWGDGELRVEGAWVCEDWAGPDWLRVF